MKVAVLLPDVDDECQRRPQSRDIAEILFGTHADVDAATRPEYPYQMNEAGLVRDEIVGMLECAGRFGQIGGQAPELLVGQSLRQRRPESGTQPASGLTDEKR